MARGERRKARRANLSDLIAAKDYAQAIEVLREQLGQRPPGIQRRLQLADLLLLAGRRDEALPILEALAGELMNDGFAAKAVAILKRIDKLDPGRPDVEARLAQLAHRPQRPVEPVAPTPSPGGETEAKSVSIGIEEIRDEPEAVTASAPTPAEDTSADPSKPAEAAAVPSASDTSPAPSPDPPTAAAKPESGHEGGGFTSMLKRLFTMLPRKSEDAEEKEAAPKEDEPAKEPGAPAVGETAELAEDAAAKEAAPKDDALKTATEAPSEAPAEPEAEAAEQAPADPTTETETETEPETEAARSVVDVGNDSSPNVVEKLGGVFKKFLAALPGGDDGDADSEVAAREFVAALAASGLDQDDDEGEFIAAFIDDDPTAPAEPILDAIPEPSPEPVPEPTAAGATPEPTAATSPAPAAPARANSGVPITEADFRDQVLDLLEQVLKQPSEPATEVPATENTEPLAAAYRDTLLVHPLFADLSPSEMLAMLRALRLVFVEPGDIIVTEGEPGASLFLIISGDVLLFVRNPEGHNIEVGRLSEGAFFGEMSLLSGRPRNATVTAGARVEMLELPKALLDGIAQAHPRVRDIVDALYLQRASSPEVAAVRSVPSGHDGDTRARAREVLRTYFGGRRFEPRMQLKLATVLLKAGKHEEAVPVLVTLANELLHEGDTAKAIAILKKVELIRTRSLEVMNLAPLVRGANEPLPPPAPVPLPTGAGARTEAFFAAWLTDTVRRVGSEAQPTPARRIPGYGPELLANPLFEGFTEEEALAFIQGLRLLAFEPGEVILTEGESGESVLILASGAVKVCVRDPTGRSVTLCELHEGAFFGEISTLSGRPRSATVTAAWHCELLELDRASLDAIAATHPRVRQVLEETYIERAASPEAARIRTAGRLQPEA